MGLMRAIELVQDRQTKATAETARLMEAAKANRILTGTGGLHGNVIRISRPLNIRRADVDQFIRLPDLRLASVGG